MYLLLLALLSEPDLLYFKLGDDNFAVRQAYDDRLAKKLNYATATKLKLTRKISSDLEIKWRCGKLLHKYYADVNKERPMIWAIPNKLRFPLGYRMIDTTWVTKFDLGRHYYVKAAKYGATRGIYYPDTYFIATDMLVEDLLSWGVPKQVVNALLANMKQRVEKGVFNYYYGGDIPAPHKD